MKEQCLLFCFYSAEATAGRLMPDSVHSARVTAERPMSDPVLYSLCPGHSTYSVDTPVRVATRCLHCSAPSLRQAMDPVSPCKGKHGTTDGPTLTQHVRTRPSRPGQQAVLCQCTTYPMQGYGDAILSLKLIFLCIN